MSYYCRLVSDWIGLIPKEYTRRPMDLLCCDDAMG